MEFLWSIYTALMFSLIGIGAAQISPFLIDCGSNSSVTVKARKWVGDLSPDNSNMTISYPGSVASTAMDGGDSAYEGLYKTARVFTKSSNYTFQVIPSSYFVRMHFYPFSFDNLSVNESKFDVMANSLKLVTEFSVVGEISRKNAYLQTLGSNLTISSLIKEYLLAVNSSNLLIQFVPSDGSFAFVNAIEIFPVSSNLFMGPVNRVGGTSVDSSSFSSRGMETMHRLNVGGSEIEPDQDQDLWRKWESDHSYLFAQGTGNNVKNSSNISYASVNDSLAAPLLVYETARVMSNAQVLERKFNMSWKFDVDPNFDYLVRLHFCEFDYDKANQRIFKIYINQRTASENFDVFALGGGRDKAFHKDYVDALARQINTLWIQLGPDMSTGASNTDALLNGLEIFKLSRSGNLGYASEIIDSGGKGAPSRKSKSWVLWLAIGVVILAIAVLSASCTAFFCYRKSRKKTSPIKTQSAGFRPLFLHAISGSMTNARASKLPSNANGSMATTRLGRRFTIAEIRAATKNFDESLVIGTGGFGKVFKGEIEEGNLVAIKRAHPQSEQGLAEFETEIEMLSKLRHRHLVSMIGYCEEQHEMILVYEYMANGTLRSHLFGADLPPLSWKQRLDVCIGAARGLHYLHTGAEGGIIHRDVKTTNILLDENFVAKVADFGLSKTGPSFDRTHVSTAVKGSFGYLDPEYFRRQQLTDKSDVYSFGVVLFEVVCARPVINPTLPREQINLADWAIQWQRQGLLEKIIDTQLNGNYSVESLKKFGEIAEKCLADEGKNRPTMGEVLWHLEYVLQLHDAYTRNNDDKSWVMTESTYTNSSLPCIGEGEEEALTNPTSAEQSLLELKRDMGSEDSIRVIERESFGTTS
eukprot:TRINITY_DN6324_c0_g1_i1.p1 TRINITY_DN6324_c0_g1~~TRINITY_DN6324_c0_g1_i1.p1  ORF type:complete len:868 (+),score=170.66 TRINITY_DN6324_c0_g1_i1:560-3163(+)